MIIVTNVTLFFRNYGNKCICSIYSSKCGLHPCNFAKKWISRKKMPICSQVFSEHGKRDIYFFSFLSFFTHHFRLSIQPFHVGKVAVNRTFAVKLIPHEFYALDQWNFNPKKKIFFLKPLKGILSISKHDARSIHSSLSNLRHAL